MRIYCGSTLDHDLRLETAFQMLMYHMQFAPSAKDCIENKVGKCQVSNKFHFGARCGVFLPLLFSPAFLLCCRRGESALRERETLFLFLM